MCSRAHRLTPLLSLISVNSPRLPDLKRAHALLIVSGAIRPRPIARRIISLYCLRSIDDPVLLHSQLQFRDPIASNLVVKFLVRSSQPIQVLSFFCQEVHPIGCRPSKCTFPLLITAAKICKSISHGELLHCLAVKLGFMFHAPIPNSLVHMYAYIQAFDHAKQLFVEMPIRDTVAYNSLLSAYVKNGYLEEAESLFSSMPEDNAISRSILFKGYLRNRQFEKGHAFFNQILILGLIPHEHSIITLLSVIIQFKLVPRGKMVHGFVIKRLLNITARVRIALINFYCICGHPDSAIFLFEQTRMDNVFLWNALISGIASLGFGKTALELFARMQFNRVKPNEDTFKCLLLTCGHAGLVDEGLEYFEMMYSVYRMKPTLDHYWCLVDLFVRTGRSDDALKIVQKLQCDGHSFLWDELISVSKERGDISICEYLGRMMIELQPDNSMIYMRLLNLYAESSRWDKYLEVINEMKQRKLKNIPDYVDHELIQVANP
ncbi:Pentatricopeptide repeat-containing protein [Rhynchospora pubera]|uniref:Pentatricopeptide repeat-containing protein n=1 Tax=Rhynchospora pubera TaxID=906938 RepID=A0AAV8GFA2_9POAL|nr:Pentatricopeptide repeat-containing protein [Rhynchospora pubera]